MSAPITVAGLRIDDPLWLALALRIAAEHHPWPRGVPPIIRQKLESFQRAAEELSEEADLLATVFAGNGVAGVEGVVFEEIVLEVEEEETEEDEEEG